MLMTSPEQAAEAVVPTSESVEAALLTTATEPVAEVSAPDESEAVEEILPAAAIPTAEQVDWQQAAREALAQAVHLPPAVRAHFTRTIEDATTAVRDALGRPLIPISDAITALSTALPLNWLQDPTTLQQAAHPHGDGYFEGNVGLTPARAAQIAQQQLAATGFAKRD